MKRHTVLLAVSSLHLLLKWLENCLRICTTLDELTQIQLGEKERHATPHSTLGSGDLKPLFCVWDSDCSPLFLCVVQTAFLLYEPRAVQRSNLTSFPGLSVPTSLPIPLSSSFSFFLFFFFKSSSSANSVKFLNKLFLGPADVSGFSEV
ncbi:hypothetical protein LEMLEM_LOCUS19942, partial [Lemmus lemmus]